jgi:hypothetical protein
MTPEQIEQLDRAREILKNAYETLNDLRKGLAKADDRRIEILSAQDDAYAAFTGIEKAKLRSREGSDIREGR